jgi:hypothetical protein
MYQLIQLLNVEQLLTRQVPALVASFILTELFYKFHSFTLECTAFLVTWYLVDSLIQKGTTVWRKFSATQSE